MRKFHRLLVLGLVGAGLAGCSDQLEVPNSNDPDAERALARPTDVEALISGSYNTVHRATVGSNNLTAPMGALAMENYSNLANFGMGTRSAVPRPPINNNRDNPTFAENYGPFLGLHRAARAAALGLSRVNRSDFTFFPPSTEQNARARAFAHFVVGVALGYVSLAYDSGSAVNENDDLTSNDPLPLMHYSALNAYALAKLDSAITIAAGMGTITIPGTWLSASATAVTRQQFIAIARGFQARFRASVARDPAERAAVNWTQVIADANAFRTEFAGADYNLLLTPSQGWDAAWIAQMYASNSVNWHMIWGQFAGMAADQATFDAWLATPLGSRNPFLVVTPDLRWPQGATRAAQQADAGTRYMQNRATGNDWFGEPLGNSLYRHIRYFPLFSASRIGNYPLITAAEMNLLSAEGELRAGNFATAAQLIDLTRTAARSGLPGLVANGVNNGTTPVPGGASCVPRVPTSASGPTVCGNMMEALKYEFRMETMTTGWGHWYFNGRGWGDLPQGTPPHWPVPYQEMDTRAQAFYSVNGPATPGNYGI